MKLITKEIQEKLNKTDSRSNKAICKFFNPVGAGTWVIFGQEQDEPDILWGVADLGLGCVEFGTISLSELQSVSLPFGMSIERDLHFYHEGKPLEFFLGRESLSGI